MKAPAAPKRPAFVFGWLALLTALLLALPAAHAREAAPAANDPVLEARVMRIAAELRCLVCQNQTIADSNADLAVDLRRQVREALQRGDSERQIIDYMTARYGDFVLYRPPLRADTALLWFGPTVLLIGGLTTLILILWRRSRLAADRFEPDGDPDTDDELAFAGLGGPELATPPSGASALAPTSPPPSADAATPARTKAGVSRIQTRP